MSTKTKKPPVKKPTVTEVANAFFDKRGVDVDNTLLAKEIKTKTGRKLTTNGLAKLKSLYRMDHGTGRPYQNRIDSLRSRVEALERTLGPIARKVKVKMVRAEDLVKSKPKARKPAKSKPKARKPAKTSKPRKPKAAVASTDSGFVMEAAA